MGWGLFTCGGPARYATGFVAFGSEQAPAPIRSFGLGALHLRWSGPLRDRFCRLRLGTGKGKLINNSYEVLAKRFKKLCIKTDVEPRGLTSRTTFISHRFEGLFQKDFDALQEYVGHDIDSKVTVRHYCNLVNPDNVKIYFLLPLKILVLLTTET